MLHKRTINRFLSTAMLDDMGWPQQMRHASTGAPVTLYRYPCYITDMGLDAESARNVYGFDADDENLARLFQWTIRTTDNVTGREMAIVNDQRDIVAALMNGDLECDVPYPPYVLASEHFADELSEIVTWKPLSGQRARKWADKALDVIVSLYDPKMPDCVHIRVQEEYDGWFNDEKHHAPWPWIIMDIHVDGGENIVRLSVSMGSRNSVKPPILITEDAYTSEHGILDDISAHRISILHMAIARCIEVSDDEAWGFPLGKFVEEWGELHDEKHAALLEKRAQREREKAAREAERERQRELSEARIRQAVEMRKATRAALHLDDPIELVSRYEDYAANQTGMAACRSASVALPRDVLSRIYAEHDMQLDKFIDPLW